MPKSQEQKELEIALTGIELESKDFTGFGAHGGEPHLHLTAKGAAKVSGVLADRCWLKSNLVPRERIEELHVVLPIEKE